MFWYSTNMIYDLASSLPNPSHPSHPHRSELELDTRSGVACSQRKKENRNTKSFHEHHHRSEPTQSLPPGLHPAPRLSKIVAAISSPLHARHLHLRAACEIRLTPQHHHPDKNAFSLAVRGATNTDKPILYTSASSTRPEGHQHQQSC